MPPGCIQAITDLWGAIESTGAELGSIGEQCRYVQTRVDDLGSQIRADQDKIRKQAGEVLETQTHYQRLLTELDHLRHRVHQVENRKLDGEPFSFEINESVNLLKMQVEALEKKLRSLGAQVFGIEEDLLKKAEMSDLQNLNQNWEQKMQAWSRHWEDQVLRISAVSQVSPETPMPPELQKYLATLAAQITAIADRQEEWVPFRPEIDSRVKSLELLWNHVNPQVHQVTQEVQRQSADVRRLDDQVTKVYARIAKWEEWANQADGGLHMIPELAVKIANLVTFCTQLADGQIQVKKPAPEKYGLQRPEKMVAGGFVPSARRQKVSEIGSVGPVGWEEVEKPTMAPPLVLGEWDTQQSSVPEKLIVTKKMPHPATKDIPSHGRPRSISEDKRSIGPEKGHSKRPQIGPPPMQPKAAEGLPLELLASVVEGVVQEREKKKSQSPPTSSGSSVRFKAPPGPEHMASVYPWVAQMAGGTPAMAASHRVNALNLMPSSPFMNMLFGPQAAAMIADITKPSLFEDKPEDWDRFDREWKKYEQLIMATGMIMPDAMRLEALKNRIGPASRLMLQEMEERNPHLQFKQYYQALASHYSRDATEQARIAWRKVTLMGDSQGVITLGTFRKFCGEFKVLRNRVGDWTATEEYNLLIQNLPEFWVIKLKEEEHRRQKSKFWAKITNAPDVSAGELRDALRAGEHDVREVKATDGGFLVSTPSEEALCALEGLTGHLLGDRAVKVARTQIRMSGDEILAWMDEKLRIQDEARECVSLHDRGMAKPPYRFQNPQAQGYPAQVYQTSVPARIKGPEEAKPHQGEKTLTSAAAPTLSSGQGRGGE